MEKTCSKDHVHLPLEGTAVTLSASYPNKMVERMVKYFLQVSIDNKVRELKADLNATEEIQEIDLTPEDRHQATEAWNALPRKEQDVCVGIVAKLHKNMNHGSIRNMVIALKRLKVHVAIIHAAENYKCEICEMAKRKVLVPVSSGMSHEPGKVVGTDNFYWTHPSGKRSVRAQIFVDYGSDVI